MICARHSHTSVVWSDVFIIIGKQKLQSSFVHSVLCRAVEKSDGNFQVKCTELSFFE